MVYKKADSNNALEGCGIADGDKYPGISYTLPKLDVADYRAGAWRKDRRNAMR